MKLNLEKVFRRKKIAFSILFIVFQIGLVLAQANGPVPPEVLTYPMDWPLPNKDYANTRTTFDVDINSDNVKSLELAWSEPINATSLFGGASSNPIVIGDTVYFQDLNSNIFSMDLKSGESNWKKLYNMTTIGPNGPVAGWGKIFMAKGVYNITALDVSTGKEVWTTNISTGPTIGIDIQPTVYNNTVYVSSVPGTSASDFYTGGGIGVIYALDQKTGKVRWSFSTVDSPEIWSNWEVNSGGGAGILRHWTSKPV
ncbi:MAG: PQQ-binding-like beta-propeller repeat protein [Methanotrichaceae archaeon]|nr:PQQ-binding-like beta-propeller repeat protein [Methanotrichaceae archaeon]